MISAVPLYDQGASRGNQRRMYDFGNTEKGSKKSRRGGFKMRILGISGVSGTIPTRVSTPNTGFNVNLRAGKPPFSVSLRKSG